MVYVSRKEHFNAAHRLFREDWSDAKNEEVFGSCANKNGHGHNFEIIVTIKGNPDPETGFVIDLKKLSQLIRREILEKLDHKNLNLDVDFLQKVMPSCENIVEKTWDILEPKINEITRFGSLHCIRLYETPRNYVEYFGEK